MISREFLFVILSTCLAEISAGWEKMLVTTKTFTECPGNLSVPNPMTNISLNYLGEDQGFLMSGELKVTKVVSHGAMILLEAQKCIDENEYTSCRFYHRFEIEFCSSLFQGNYWTKWLDTIEGFGPCPLQARNYRITDLPLDFNDKRQAWHVIINPEQFIGHWIADVRVVYNNELMTCFQSAGDIKKRRRKSKKKTLSLTDVSSQANAENLYSRSTS